AAQGLRAGAQVFLCPADVARQAFGVGPADLLRIQGNVQAVAQCGFHLPVALFFLFEFRALLAQEHFGGIAGALGFGASGLRLLREPQGLRSLVSHRLGDAEFLLCVPEAGFGVGAGLLGFPASGLQLLQSWRGDFHPLFQVAPAPHGVAALLLPPHQPALQVNRDPPPLPLPSRNSPPRLPPACRGIPGSACRRICSAWTLASMACCCSLRACRRWVSASRDFPMSKPKTRSKARNRTPLRTPKTTAQAERRGGATAARGA